MCTATKEAQLGSTQQMTTRGATLVLKVLSCGICLVAFATTLTGCGASTPQACQELAPAVEDYNAMRRVYFQDPSNPDLAGGFRLATRNFAQTALAVADTSSAREEGISEELRDLASMMVQGIDDPQAAGVSGILAIDIDKLCGFKILNDETAPPSGS